MKKTFRYERKFVLQGTSGKNVELMVRMHPSIFREVYPERYVNNIYCDNLELSNCFDNIDGVLDRAKPRIRWYGNLLGIINDPILEIKRKRGFLGRKDYYRLKNFIIDEHFTIMKLRELYINSALPPEILSSILNFRPTLLNRYCRKYYLSDNKKYRITIDYGLEYYQPNYLMNLFCHKCTNSKDVILELKYDDEHDQTVANITNEFPFLLSKYSKYVNGIQALCNTEL